MEAFVRSRLKQSVDNDFAFGDNFAPFEDFVALSFVLSLI